MRGRRRGPADADAPLPGRRSAPARLSPQAERGDIKLVLLGEFGRAHGLRGELRLKSHTADPLAIARYGPLVGPDGRRFILSSVRPARGEQPGMLVARVEGVSTREAAEALNRVALHVERERLDSPGDDEVYVADLIGLRVDGPDGPLGRVVEVPDYGGGPLLEIAPIRGGRTVLIPFTKAFVSEVDLPGGRLVVDPPPDLLRDEGGRERA